MLSGDALKEAIRRDYARKRAGREALHELMPDGGTEMVDEVLYALAREVLALRERVAALEQATNCQRSDKEG